MERFAINILHQKIQNICRLCGVDNPVKKPIVEDDDIICLDDDDEVTLVKKIEECVGIKVYKTDRMPQLICSLCIDKVNDFYEYRLMCAATNIQTRSILNLPPVEPTTVLVKTEPVEPDPPPLEEETHVACDSRAGVKRGKKTRSRKNDNADTHDLHSASTEKRIKTEYTCQYCNEACDTNGELERHLVSKHTPLIRKYGCGTCAELFDTAVEYKDHHEWHRQTRTGYYCYRCKRRFVKMCTLSKHLQINACVRNVRKSTSTTLVPDMQCKLCSKIFKTQNLYEWHGCFLKSRRNCPKCGKYFLKKNVLITHYIVYCTGTLALVEPVLVKTEQKTLGADGFPEPIAMSEKTEQPVKRRGRPRLLPRVEELKEETTELPFPPLLDLPEMKLENIPSEVASSEANAVPDMDVEAHGRKRLKLSFAEEAEPNESSATVSLTRKKKKHEDQTYSNNAENKANDPNGNAVPSSMLVLSMANFKPEPCESPVVPAVSGEIDLNPNATNSREAQEEAVGGNAEDTYDGEDDGFAGYDDTDSIDHMEAGGSDRETEESTPTGKAIQHEHPSQMAPPVVRIKQESMTDPRSSSDAENGGEYELAISCLAIKHEPVDEEEEPAHERRTTRNSATAQALRINIKKEKGLYNATEVAEEESDLIQASLAADVASKPEDSVSSHQKKPTKKANTPNHYKVRTMRSRPAPPPVEPEVRIKQERCETEEDRQSEESFEDVDEEYGSVAIKQEQLDCLAGLSDPDRSVFSRSSEIAFDGMQIKQERREAAAMAIWPTAKNNDVTDGLQSADGDGNLALRQADSPLIGTFNEADSSLSQSEKSKKASSGSSKSSRRINPFALLKRKTLTAANVRETISEGPGPSAERVSLPVIAQVTSVEPEEHFAESVGSSPCEEQVDDNDDGTIQSTDLEHGKDVPVTAQATSVEPEEHLAEAVGSSPCEEQTDDDDDGTIQSTDLEHGKDAPVTAQATSVEPEEHLAEAVGSSPCEEQTDDDDDGTIQSTDLEHGKDAPVTAQATSDDREEHLAEAVGSSPCGEQNANKPNDTVLSKDAPVSTTVPVVLSKAGAEPSTEWASAENVITQPISEQRVALMSSVQDKLMLGDEADCAVQEKIISNTGLDPDSIENRISSKAEDLMTNIGDNISIESLSDGTDISSGESSKCSADKMYTFRTDTVLRKEPHETEHSDEGKSNISVQLEAKPNEIVKKPVEEVENYAQKESTEEDVISPNEFKHEKGTSNALASQEQTPKVLTAQPPQKSAEVAVQLVKDVDNEAAKGSTGEEAMEKANDDSKNEGTSKILASKEDVTAIDVIEKKIHEVDDNDATTKITQKKIICSNDVMEAEEPTEALAGGKSSPKETTAEGTDEIAEMLIPEVDIEPTKEPTEKEIIVSNGVIDDEGSSKEEVVSKVLTSEEQSSTSKENEKT